MKGRDWYLPAAVITVGIGGMIGQLLLIRVLMVTFLGNELSLSIVIANWLLFEGLGSYLGGKLTGFKKFKVSTGFLAVFVLYPFILIGAIFLARFLGYGLPGMIVGEAMSLGQMLLTALVTVGFTGIFHGVLFPLAAQLFQHSAREQPVSSAYLIEITGTIAGGLVFVFLLAPNFTAMEVSALLVLLHLPLSVLLAGDLRGLHAGGGRTIVMIAVLAVIVLAFPAVTDYLHLNSLEGMWPEGEIEGYHNSPYGNIVTLSREGEKTVLYDGRSIMTLPHPDTARLQDYAYLAAAAHEEPEDVLLIGGGLGGLISFLIDHPLEELVFAEIDPELLEVARGLDFEILQEEFEDERTEIINRDGRQYLLQTDRDFDLIMLGGVDTETLQTNRFFTREFFGIMKENLRPGGKVAFTLPGSMTYLGDELALLNSSLYHTAAEVFADVKLIPGEENIMLASQEEIDLSPKIFADRLQERGLYGGMFTGGYLNYRLDPNRIERFNRRLGETPARINRDFSPAGFLYGLLNWARAYAPEALDSGYLLVEQLELIAILAAAAVSFIAYKIFFISRSSRANHLTYAIFTSGGIAMAFDLFTMFAFQSLFGHIYQLNGLFIAAFMGGMYAGGRLCYRSIDDMNSEDLMSRSFLGLEIAVIGLLLAFPLMVNLLRELMLLPAAAIMGAVICVIFAVAAGGVIGAQFPLAVNLLPEKLRDEAGTAAGRIYTADLIGGWLAGMFVGLILFPVLGLTMTLLFLALLKLTSLILISRGDKNA